MNTIVLTVQPCGNGDYRLAISAADSRRYFKERRQTVKLTIGERVFLTKTTCGNAKKGYDLYSQEINEWITQNGYNKYPEGNPYKFKFEMESVDEVEMKLNFKSELYKIEKADLKDVTEHVSFEMNRLLYTFKPPTLPGRYVEIVAESYMLHARNVGEFFFEGKKCKDDVRITDYFEYLTSTEELRMEIDKCAPLWMPLKTRINKKLQHLTFTRCKEGSMGVFELRELNFKDLIEFFRKNLPEEFQDKWKIGESFCK